MLVHIFKASGNWYGFTREESGTNLPGDKGPWVWMKSVEMIPDHPASGIGVDEYQVLIAINATGYYLTNAAIHFEEKE